MKEMNVAFDEKDQFKEACQKENLRAVWDKDKRKWAVDGLDNNLLPASLKKWDTGGIPRYWVIACDYSYYPFASRAGARWDATHKVAIFRGVNLPLELTGFRPAPFSYQERVEMELNGEKEAPTNPTKLITLHKHQEEGITWIDRGHESKAPGFLLADETGLGKTITVWSAILKINERMGKPLRIIITGPLGAMEAWRETIQWLGSGGYKQTRNDIVLINYERIKHLFTAGDKKAKTLKGVAKFSKGAECDILIFDESHYLKNQAAARTKLAKELEKAAGYVIWMSATAGQNPLEIAYLSNLLAHITHDKRSTIEKDYEKWCQTNGIGVKRGAFGKWTWEAGAEDNAVLHKILFGPKKLAIRRRCSDIAGWPEIKRIPRGWQFDGTAQTAYQAEWEAFKQAYEADRLERLKGNKDTGKGIAQLTRLRQKASLLRVEHTAELAQDLLEEGRQVAISTEYLGSLDSLRDKLTMRGYKVGEFSGRNSFDRENIRKAYQSGDLDVIIFTTESAISLHQEKDADKPRAQINHDLRWSGIEQEQVDGRSHRNGRFAPVYWCFAKNTIEERVATILLAKLESMGTLRGDVSDFKTIYDEIAS